MTTQFPDHVDAWLLHDAPLNAVVVSSRARLARNVASAPFAFRANPDQLHYVADKISRAFGRSEPLQDYLRYDLGSIEPLARRFMRESHLISYELERDGGPDRLVFTSPSLDSSIMINEEDHLRMTTLAAGFHLHEVFDRLRRIETAMEQELELAYSEEFGYLAACPTNAGTGLRLSVMLHLPGLALGEKVDESLLGLNELGLVVRGAYGENSDHAGDLYQISNEVTLGKSEEDLLELLESVVRQIVERELEMRHKLLNEANVKLQDAVCRAIGILASARQIDSSEAITLLSRVRLGINQEWGIAMPHPELSRLFFDIQPGHLQYRRAGYATPQERDCERARLLRERFGGGASRN